VESFKNGIEKRFAEERVAYMDALEATKLSYKMDGYRSSSLALMRRQMDRLFLTNARSISLGIVTFNNPGSHIRRLLHTIEIAADRLHKERCSARLFSIDCGHTIEWPTGTVIHRRLPAEGNLGFGRGMNRLMVEAFSDPSTHYFLCVNPDGLLHPDLLAEMVRTSDLYPDSLIEARQFPEEHPKPYDLSGLTTFASGACLLIPRTIYQTIGGFDDNLFMYMEDVDYSWRARTAGFSVRVAPKALFSHSVLDREPDPVIERHYYESGRYLAYKWGKPTEQAHYESILVNQGHSLQPLPLLEGLNSRRPTDTSVADFSYGFAYAPVRWS
jgi:hypothetical protein